MCGSEGDGPAAPITVLHFRSELNAKLHVRSHKSLFLALLSSQEISGLALNLK